MQGVVRKLFTDKGFGFIRGENNADYFFHRSQLQNAKFEDMAEGDAVSFEGADGPKGPKAEDVYLD